MSLHRGVKWYIIYTPALCPFRMGLTQARHLTTSRPDYAHISCRRFYFTAAFFAEFWCKVRLDCLKKNYRFCLILDILVNIHLFGGIIWWFQLSWPLWYNLLDIIGISLWRYRSGVWWVCDILNIQNFAQRGNPTGTKSRTKADIFFIESVHLLARLDYASFTIMRVDCGLIFV